MLRLPLTLSGLPGLPTIHEETLIWFIQYETVLQWDPCRRQDNCVELCLTRQCELGACHIAALGVALPEVQLILLTKTSSQCSCHSPIWHDLQPDNYRFGQKDSFKVTCACQDAPSHNAATAVYFVHIQGSGTCIPISLRNAAHLERK